MPPLQVLCVRKRTSRSTGIAKKSHSQVWRILLLLLLTTSASTCLQHSHNLGMTLSETPVIVYVLVFLSLSRLSSEALRSEHSIVRFKGVCVVSDIATLQASLQLYREWKTTVLLSYSHPIQGRKFTQPRNHLFKQTYMNG